MLAFALSHLPEPEFSPFPLPPSLSLEYYWIVKLSLLRQLVLPRKMVVSFYYILTAAEKITRRTQGFIRKNKTKAGSVWWPPHVIPALRRPMGK